MACRTSLMPVEILADMQADVAGSDSPESAAKELSQVFENWDTTWWIDQRNKGVEFL